MNDNGIRNEKKVLKIGLPSLHSRLHAKVMEILNLPCYKNSQRLVFYSGSAVIFFLRPWDLPKMVELGYIDLAFCGIDTVIELGVNVSIYHRFKEFQSSIGFCKRIGVKLIEENPILVATEYPRIAKEYLNCKYKNYEIIQVKGATEAYPHLEGISAIVDIVESGQTLRANHLHLVEEIEYTYPCLIHNPKFDIVEKDLNVVNLSSLIGNALKLDLIEIEDV